MERWVILTKLSTVSLTGSVGKSGRVGVKDFLGGLCFGDPWGRLDGKLVGSAAGWTGSLRLGGKRKLFRCYSERFGIPYYGSRSK